MDAAEPSTLASVPEWVSLFREVVGPVPIILLVNKWDMVDKASYDMGPVRRVCKELDIGSMFSSGKSGENVKDMFLNLTEAILQVRPF
jgi:50S ribosomal subunit-associated GTPase HflX